jgi:formate dehydrogenase major subunit
MAECHPVAFQWVTEAKARGATVIHVDPRFTRTSALSDLYVPIRAGADIAFVGGLINYVLRNEKYFREYVLACTNAATILTEDYADTEDFDGVFSGLNREHRYYDFDTWRYQGEDEVKPASGERLDPDAQLRIRRRLRQAGRGEAQGSGGAAACATPDTDETLQHPRCVFQVLKRHFARYTPELVRTAKAGAAGAISLSMVALVHDLGRPARFVNMLRVFKVTSPMSVGTWVLSALARVASSAPARSSSRPT